ncbi:MAG: PKD domain-containing protein [Bacteroidales bacterium]|nr:PKD domain-containing protein [Bacteroidales bacterium]
MKKLYFSTFLCVISLGLMSQPVARQQVILEIGTGTWCQYCPGAAMGADDLIEAGCQVGVIEYHNGDSFTNTASDARNAYYNIPGYPTAHFDGVLEYVGGSNTQSMYPNYLPLYQQRIVIPSNFTIQIFGQHTGSTYDVQLVITKESGTWTTLTAQLALTESEIVYSWQGQNQLNYVERLMAPDHLGTQVDFTSENTVVLNLQFTISSDWVTNNCEIVAFLQNDGTKEILQGNKVAIPNLQPMPATAGFECTDNTPCITTSVEYEDQSLGEIISWNWVFEGGNPPTSTVQNPVIAYNALGQYDVRLIVYDGEVYDTLLNPEYILVIAPPVQPMTPTGPTVVCQGSSGFQYLTNSVQWATTYTWSIDPPAAGTISGPDTVAPFTLAPGYLGPYTIKVRADNGCGTGTWSQGLNATAHFTPDQFTLSEGGGYCEGAEGFDLTLDGSQQGVNYELYLDGDATGQIMAGTGSALDFGFQTEEGIYTCLAYTDYCDNAMIGNAYIYMIHQPVKAGTPTGSTQECNNHNNVTYTTDGAINATSYSWTLTPSGAGMITGNTTTAIIDWDDAFYGMAFISVVGVNSCFSGPPSDNLNVTVNAAPQPAITGDQEVCEEDLGILYSTADNSGNTYTWELAGGTIASGAGTHEISVNWGNPGSGYVKVTETDPQGCTVTTANYDIFIDDCLGIGEGNGPSFSIFPNPVKDELIIRFAGQAADSRIVIINQLGQVLYDHQTDGNQQFVINTSTLSRGVYGLRMYGENGNSERKFIKVE